MPCPLAVGRGNERRDQLLLPSPMELRVARTFSKELVDVVPAPTRVAQVVRARVLMNWEELAQNTLFLGDRWPMLLAMVRAAEVEGDAERVAERARDEKLFKQNRRRVLRKLRGGTATFDRTLMVATADGCIPKVYKDKEGARTRALKLAQQRA